MIWLPPRTDDGNQWGTGTCMLYCREWGRVLDIGAAKTPFGEGRVYACEPCLHEFADMVEQQVCEQDLRDLIAK